MDVSLPRFFEAFCFMDEELRNVWAINGDISYLAILARPNMLLCMVSIGLARFSKKHGRTQRNKNHRIWIWLHDITWCFFGNIAAIFGAPVPGGPDGPWWDLRLEAALEQFLLDLAESEASEARLGVAWGWVKQWNHRKRGNSLG